jgi:hypothetical protein
MIYGSRKTILLSAAAAMGFMAGLMGNDRATLYDGLTSSAEARIGRPLTPISYAGVARRTTRRAIVYGGAAAAVAAGAYAVTPACTQVVDAYGQIQTVC